MKDINMALADVLKGVTAEFPDLELNYLEAKTKANKPCLVHFTVSESAGSAWDNAVTSRVVTVQVSVYGPRTAENGMIALSVRRVMDTDGWMMIYSGDAGRQDGTELWAVHMRFKKRFFYDE